MAGSALRPGDYPFPGHSSLSLSYSDSGLPKKSKKANFTKGQKNNSVIEIPYPILLIFI